MITLTTVGVLLLLGWLVRKLWMLGMHAAKELADTKTRTAAPVRAP